MNTFREIMILVGVVGISCLLVSLAILCVIPQEELQRARNKREFDRAVRNMFCKPNTK